jgi:hypothetical protein
MKTRPGRAVYNPPGAPGAAPSASIDIGITSLTDLAAVATVNLIAPAVRYWVQASDGTTQVWQLLSSSANTSEGVLRPNDYNDLTNRKVWFKASS